MENRRHWQCGLCFRLGYDAIHTLPCHVSCSATRRLKLFRLVVINNAFENLFLSSLPFFSHSFFIPPLLSMIKHHFPLSSSDSIEVVTPLFISPVTLLTFITLFSFGRFIHTRASPWLDYNVQSRSRSWTALTKLLVTLCICVLLTLLVDCGAITARAFADSVWTSNLLTFYESTLFVAWMVCLWTLIDELHKFGQVYWIHYCYWMIAVLAETCVGWLWALTVKRPESGKENKWNKPGRPLLNLAPSYVRHLLDNLWTSASLFLYYSLHYPMASCCLVCGTYLLAIFDNRINFSIE